MLAPVLAQSQMQQINNTHIIVFKDIYIYVYIYIHTYSTSEGVLAAMLLVMLGLCESPGARLARASQGSYLCEASDKSYPLGCSIGWKCSRKPIDPTWNMFLSQNKCFTCEKSRLATEIPVQNVHLGRSKVGLPGFRFAIQAVDGLPLPRANYRGRSGPEHRLLLPQPDLWGKFLPF